MSNPRPVTTPSRIRVQADADGIRAISERGNEIRYSVTPSTPGFNPLELLSASLGICTAINLRRELVAAGGGAATPFALVVECVKAGDAPSRVARLSITIHLDDAVAGDRTAELVRRAEAACTIANTLHASPRIVTARPPGQPAT
jgi:uncharacterized OsmC-like protein